MRISRQPLRGPIVIGYMHRHGFVESYNVTALDKLLPNRLWDVCLTEGLDVMWKRDERYVGDSGDDGNQDEENRYVMKWQ